MKNLGTVLEVNVSELGLVTQTGKVVWSKYAQVTNNPELDGCINAVLLVWNVDCYCVIFVKIKNNFKNIDKMNMIGKIYDFIASQK